MHGWWFNIGIPCFRPPHWPSGRAFASRAEDPRFEYRLRRDFFRVFKKIPVTSKLALQWLPCQAPGFMGSALDWSAWCQYTVTGWGRTFDLQLLSQVWQHVNLSEQIRPWDTLACCWDVKQPTNKQPSFRTWEISGDDCVLLGYHWPGTQTCRSCLARRCPWNFWKERMTTVCTPAGPLEQLYCPITLWVLHWIVLSCHANLSRAPQAVVLSHNFVSVALDCTVLSS